MYRMENLYPFGTIYIIWAKDLGGIIMCNNNQQIKRGDIFYADLGSTGGSEQGGVRPVVIIQNDIGNKYSPTVIIAAITSKIDKTKLPTHLLLKSSDYDFRRDSVILTEQIRTLDKRKLKEKIGRLYAYDIEKLNECLNISLSLAI